jgi:hypothetical protein
MRGLWSVSRASGPTRDRSRPHLGGNQPALASAMPSPTYADMPSSTVAALSRIPFMGRCSLCPLLCRLEKKTTREQSPFRDSPSRLVTLRNGSPPVSKKGRLCLRVARGSPQPGPVYAGKNRWVRRSGPVRGLTSGRKILRRRSRSARIGRAGLSLSWCGRWESNPYPLSGSGF